MAINMNMASFIYRRAKDRLRYHLCTKSLDALAANVMASQQSDQLLQSQQIHLQPSSVDASFHNKGKKVFNLQDGAQQYREWQTVTEPPMERLQRAIDNISPRNLASAVGDMYSLVNLGDKLGDYIPSTQVFNLLQDEAQQYTDCQTVTEPSLKRLKRAIDNMSPRNLASAVEDMYSLVIQADKLDGSAYRAQSRAAIGEDLAQVTECRRHGGILSSLDGGRITKTAK
ncbi:hypothetical protein KP509_13G022700 [Ceratopteris richardii]|uniref:Uncharacterized protein n=1 Tax=Ceratopteris richardii TaxID=49495 RepID=A0A8T2TDZ9_CERRI|nr:hypothetical protein KP509_13G022700 [Ceratopteris richardii]